MSVLKRYIQSSIITSLVIGLWSVACFAQQNKNVLETTITIESKALNEQREVQIYLPDSYFSTSKKYPVIYIIDGQRYFLNAVTYQKNLTWQEVSPEFIIVGLPTDSQKRRRLFYRESSKFINFLENELIPQIDNEYRTLDERIYFGWEMAAGLGVEILSDSPHLFKAMLLASPTHISNSRLQKVDSLLNNTLDQNTFIYASLGTVENWSIKPMADLDSIFRKNNQEQLTWNYNLSATENHYTTPLTTINEGLKLFFGDYAPLRFFTLQEFYDFGGLEALKSHYTNRSKRYHTPEGIHNDTKHYLLLQCDKEDNFELFNDLVEEFDGKAFIANHYRQPRWFLRYSQFYARHNHLDDALDILKLGDDKFPDTATLKNEIGNIYKKSGATLKAKKWYKEAEKHQ
ncbi:alpha/beta hydrolase [Fulvivirga aurantia]|uniref:alpha/beta hydrolase n=1 Tax=Fulvivirga aurantia TaxID=2529383 RepID=UPI001629BBAF|nr:alpha/beta hydrolase-fold protein [Fulvivirga aurantia]